jgi:hypothetical protein
MNGTKEYIQELKNYIEYLKDMILILHNKIESDSLLREIDILCSKITKERREKLNG